MRYLFILAFLFSGCGYSSRQNEMIGQVKKIAHQTPLICPNYAAADISLGVIRGGVGSMSTQDIWLTVDSKDDEKLLIDAAASGAIVKLNYDVARLTLCVEDHIITNVEVVQ